MAFFKIKRQISSRVVKNFYILTLTSAVFSFSNFLIASSAELYEGGSACLYDGSKYDMCGKVDRPNGYFWQFTDQEEYCESFI
jgi:hypothetical protein